MEVEIYIQNAKRKRNNPLWILYPVKLSFKIKNEKIWKNSLQVDLSCMKYWSSSGWKEMTTNSNSKSWDKIKSTKMVNTWVNMKNYMCSLYMWVNKNHTYIYFSFLLISLKNMKLFKSGVLSPWAMYWYRCVAC